MAAVSALREMAPSDQRVVRDLFNRPDPPDDAVRTVVEAVGRTGGLEYARTRGEEYGDRARSCLDGLPVGDCLDALHAAVDFVTQRQS